MSNVVKGITKVFKKVFKVAKKIAIPVAIGGAILLTAGAAGVGPAAGWLGTAQAAAGGAAAGAAAGAATPLAAGSMLQSAPAGIGFGLGSGASAVGAGLGPAGVASGIGGAGLGASIAQQAVLPAAAGVLGGTMTGGGAGDVTTTATSGKFMKAIGNGLGGIKTFAKDNPVLFMSGLQLAGGIFSQQADMAMLRERMRLEQEFSGRGGTYFEIDQDGNAHPNATWMRDPTNKVLSDPKAYVDGRADRLAHAQRYPTPTPPMSQPQGVPSEPLDVTAQQGTLQVAAGQQPGALPGVVNPWQMPVSGIPRWELTEVPA